MKKRTQGMNWLPKARRLAIYLRDGLACAYCGASVENDAKLSLDHLKPYSKGGTNETSNLVTACFSCNSGRGNHTVRGFCRVVAAYLNNGVTGAEIERHVRNTAARKIDKAAAKALIERRGSWAQCLKK